MLGDHISHYKILRKLGEGGMGEVFLAEDPSLGRKIAIKVLHPETAAQRDRLERFRREARSLAAINHPNIVTIYSVEDADGLHFLTMEYVDGRTLADLIPKNGYRMERFFEVAVPLSEALSAAHEHGIIHRDLKPSNVMVGRDGRVRVLDFGLAKLRGSEGLWTDTVETEELTESLTADGLIVGTTPYMSPEQLKGETVDERSDIFALGIVLYRMATGLHPFLCNNTAEMVSAILSAEPRTVTEHNPTLPRHLGRVIRHCLEKDPSHRFQTALDVRNELGELQQEVESGVAATSEVSIFPAKASGRRRVWLAAALAGALILIAALAFLVGRRGPAAQPGLRSLAVMPFANLTGRADLDHTGDGIAAGLIARLNEVQGIQVVGRTEAWSYRAEGLSASQLGRELGVGAIVEGELQRQAADSQVTVFLTDAETGFVLWSHQYTSEPDQVLRLQGRVANDLTTYLSIPLSLKERRRLAKDPTGSHQAFDFYVAGQGFLDQYDNPNGPYFAADNLRQAIRIDPTFALARAGLSEALWQIYHRDMDEEALAEAEVEANLALEIDPDLPAALVALARVHRSTGRQEAAIEKLEEVLAIHPKPGEALRELAVSYERTGNLGEAEKSLRAATALSPDDWFNWSTLGNFLGKTGKYDEARQAFLQASKLAPADVIWPLVNLASLDLAEGRFDAAIEALESLPTPIRSARIAANLGTAYYFSNRDDKWAKAEEYYLLSIRLEPKNPFYQANLGDLHQELDRPEQAGARYSQAQALIGEQLANNPDDVVLRSELAFYSAKAADCEAALRLTLQLEDILPATGPNAHQLAYIYTMCEQPDEALSWLRRAVELGEARDFIREESEFAALRNRPEFIELVGGADPEL